MKITFLGHAGFLVETESALVVTDPWLSSSGAFDGAWFQYPRNHQLAPWVRERLRTFRGERYIYISHEHQDHFDRAFLGSLEDRDFTLLVAHFTSARMERLLAGYRCKELRSMVHEETLPVPGGSLTLYVDDSVLNRDSAIFMRLNGSTFFDMNDCKLFDALPSILQSQGRPDVFSCQFSGATWHPTCYDYPPEQYGVISKKKYIAKFESVAKALDLLRPRTYLPAAGPACFLDPELAHLHQEPVNIFPRADKLLDYLAKRLQKNPVHATYLDPGESISVSESAIIKAPAVVPPPHQAGDLATYAREIGPILPGERYGNADEVFARLRTEFMEKLQSFVLAPRIEVPLYVFVRERPDRALRIDFQNAQITISPPPRTGDAYYQLCAPAWQFRRILDRELTWEEFTLTFRLQLRREPDVYQPFLHAFLLLETDAVELYCARMLDLEQNQERIVVSAGDRQFSILRWCPHMGSDLSEAHVDDRGILTCPRHRWQFDLFDGGQCSTNMGSICAVELDADLQSAS